MLTPRVVLITVIEYFSRAITLLVIDPILWAYNHYISYLQMAPLQSSAPISITQRELSLIDYEDPQCQWCYDWNRTTS